MTLVDFSTLYVGVDVNESNLARLASKQPAEITLEAYPERVYKGFLKQVIPSADRQKGTVKVKVAIVDPDENILPDLSARVSFTSEATKGASARTQIEVPKSALAVRDGKTGVFLIKDQKAVFRPVVVGRRRLEGWSQGRRPRPDQQVSTAPVQGRDAPRLDIQEVPWHSRSLRSSTFRRSIAVIPCRSRCSRTST